jgi:hypothetical protein
MPVERRIWHFPPVGMVCTCNSFIDPLLYVTDFMTPQVHDFIEYAHVELQKFWKDSLIKKA